MNEEAMYRFHSIRRITKALELLMYAFAALAVIACWSSWLQLELLGRPFSQAEAQANDAREARVSVLWLVLYIAAVVAFIRWIYVAHRNLPALGAQDLDVTPGWAIGWFFIPFLNLWKPYTSMRTLWQASHDPPQWKLADSSWLVVIWWVLWLVNALIGNALLPIAFRDDLTIEGLAGRTRLELAVGISAVPLFLVAAAIVSRVWQAQRETHARLTGGGVAPVMAA